MFIYKITNKINNKSYIGQTVGCLKKRWSKHCSEKSKCIILKNAIKKYGKDNFIIEEIDGANFQSELNYKEWLLIHKFNSLWPNGYNIKKGGEQGGKWSLKMKEHMKERGFWQYRIPWNKGKKMPSPPKEVIEKRRQSLKGKSPWNKGKKVKYKNPELRSKNISESKKGKPVSENTLNATRKKIKCIETGIVYKSISDVARELGSYTTNISKHLKGKSRHVRGFTFVYMET